MKLLSKDRQEIGGGGDDDDTDDSESYHLLSFLCAR